MSYNIVIPFDFSAQAGNTFRNAVELSDKLKAKIHIVHVAPDKITSEKRKELENGLAALQKATGSIKGKTETHLFFGPVGGSILNFCSSVTNPVIFISNNSASEGHNTNYTGPNTHFIIANAQCPVLLLKNNLEFNKINTILLPLDLNIENKLKLGYAMFLSKFFDNATIHLLCIVFDVDDFELNKLMFRLNHLNTFFEKMGINSIGEIIRCYTEDGELYSKVAVDYAEKSDAELILLMTNDEKTKPGKGISVDAEYMFTHFKNNVLSITPFVKA